MASTDSLSERADRAGREFNKVLVRWLLSAEVPLFAACVMLTLTPDDAPLGPRRVADEIGISVDDAARALHELRTLGYAREKDRLYEPTEAVIRLHEELTKARREAMRAFVASLSPDDLEALEEELGGRRAS